MKRHRLLLRMQRIFNAIPKLFKHILYDGQCPSYKICTDRCCIILHLTSELEGNIKLAFVVSKGKLEVDIISANGLPLRSDGLEPGM